MSEYGIKISNYVAGSIYEVNLGVREQYDKKDAMLVNSLFLDFLMENGLEVWNGKSTRQIIGVDFKYGSRSFEEDLKHIKSIRKKCDPDDEKRIERLDELIRLCKENKNKYDKKTKQELRTIFYRDGLDITYNTHNKKGEIINSETIHYKMLYRTPGKAKRGNSYFCDERIYDKAREFLYMGIILPEHDAQIVEIGAYSSLITSSIVGRVKIEPENILIVKDMETFYKTDVVSIETNEENECEAIKRSNYELTSVAFDGQALLDSGTFPDWAEGYCLLRHHFMKAAAFKAHIQKFFKDYFGEEYETAIVTDMWGNKHCAKDIKLITTDNAIKWLKFDVSYECWSDWVRKNGCLFGIVKTAHRSKIYPKQRMSYQMVNALDLNTIESAMKDTKDYLRQLQSDDEVFLEYLKKNINFSNDFEVLLALVEQDRDFIRSDYFRDRRRKIIETYVLNMKTGKLIQNADNLVICGSPYAMLLHAVGESYMKDETFESEDDCIQCWTSRFDDGEYLAEFRNPYNYMANMGYLKNHYHPIFDKYFDFGEMIIAVNLCFDSDFQDRNNGLIYWASVQKCT